MNGGTYRFDRQAQEVAALRALSVAELAAFGQEALLQPATRRKMVVALRGAAEAVAAAGAAAADAAAAAPAAAPAAEAGKPAAAAGGADAAPGAAASEEAEAAEGADEPLCPVADVYAFKRACEAMPAACFAGLR